MASAPQKKSLHVLKTNSKDQEGVESIVCTEQNLSGEYWDDFCLPVLAHPYDRQVVWMLGTGLAGGLRPMLMTHSVKKIIGVDIDGQTLKKAESLHQDPRFSTVCDDAVKYIAAQKQRGEKADVIWIDLFDHHGHLPAVFDPIFLESTLSALNSEGVLAINVFGVPCDPLVGWHGESYHAMRRSLNILGREFREIPYRRNISFHVSKSAAKITKVPDTSKFSVNDRIWLDICVKRLNCKVRHSDNIADTTEPHTDFESISKSMASYWDELFAICGLNPQVIQSSLDEACEIILRNNDLSSGILSIFLAAANLNQEQTNASIDAIRKVYQSSPDIVQTLYHLPQSYALFARNDRSDMDFIVRNLT